MLSCPMLLLPYFFSKIQVESRNIFFSSKLIQKMCTAFKYNRPLRVPLLGSSRKSKKMCIKVNFGTILRTEE